MTDTNMVRKIFFITAVLFIYNATSYCQSTKWENFTDLKNVTSIVSDPGSNTVYCASKGGLFGIDIVTQKIVAKYSNLNGLINNDVLSLTVDNKRRLWIGAVDGSISILNLQDLTWKYIFDIKNSTESNKLINFLLSSGNFIFVGTGYGIQKVSVINFNFVDAPYYKLGGFPVNTPVYGLTINNNILYAATKSGVAYGNTITSNLNDPNSWSNNNTPPLNANVKTIETFDNKIFAGSDSGFNYFDGGNWLPYPNTTVSNTNTKYIKAIQDKLYFISGNNVYFANRGNLPMLNMYRENNNYTTIASDNRSMPVLGLSDNGILIADNNNFLYPNGPFTNIFNQITIDENDNIWAAGGLPNNGFYKYNGTIWENYNITTHPQIGNSNWFQKIVSGNGSVWALGFGGGPTLINGTTIKNFNTSNSILPGENNPNFCVPYGGAYDIRGDFWLSFFQSNSGKSLYVYLSDNEWFGFPNPSTINAAILSNMGVDSYNTKWIVSGGARSGVYYFNENNTLTNTSDDVFGFYDNSDFGGEITNIYDLIIDKNNEVWIATNNGVFIINNPFAAIQNPAQKPPAQKLGIISGNLKVPFTENCISITNDILNNKWIGTENNGVFHLSSDGSTLLEQFNTSNSPILSNQIKTIKVSNVSGKAYFGSNNGLSSYLTDAIQPVAEFDEITASPNPYLIPSGVNLEIDGLVENSIIKIITLSGEIVSEFDSPGGRIAVWDGRNKNNELTPTGIYIIVAFNKDGSKVGKGKVAVVRK
ncbi:MAG: hypothetical protein ABIY50_10590 [Ignavibacteria bacterium]